jgi:hypothetical protein
MSTFEEEMWRKDKNGGIVLSRIKPERASHKVQLEKLRAQVAEWDYRISLARPKCRQILHLIDKFGGILNFSIAVSRHPNRIIFDWLGVTKAHKVHERYGILSSRYLVRLLHVARCFGILLTPEDLFPDLIDKGVLKNPYTHPEMKEWWVSIEPDANQQRLETQIANLLEA